MASHDRLSLVYGPPMPASTVPPASVESSPRGEGAGGAVPASSPSLRGTGEETGPAKPTKRGMTRESTVRPPDACRRGPRERALLAVGCVAGLAPPSALSGVPSDPVGFFCGHSAASSGAQTPRCGLTPLLFFRASSTPWRKRSPLTCCSRPAPSLGCLRSCW